MLHLSVSKYEIYLPKYVAKKFSLNNSVCEKNLWCCTYGICKFKSGLQHTNLSPFYYPLD